MKFTYTADARPVDGYTIRRGIHRGGFGEVYYAVSDAGKEVALKLLTHDLDTELRGVRQCLNLKHPNLVSTFDVRTDAEGDHWVIMEYINGASLEDVLRSFPHGLPETEVGAWMKGLLDGVEFLHDRGIVHRDLKPANVYRENGQVKIGDVGLSKQMGGGRRGQHTEAVGTVYYMAPEVAKGQYGPEVDVYSLAVMLYEMTTGRLPFDGETTAEILMKHLSARPDLSLLPAKLQPVIARALEKDPAKRTPSVAALRRELQGGAPASTPLPESAFADLATVSRPQTPVVNKPHPRQAHPPAAHSHRSSAQSSYATTHEQHANAWPWVIFTIAIVMLTIRTSRGVQPTWMFLAFGLGAFAAVRYWKRWDQARALRPQPTSALPSHAAGSVTRAETWAAATLTGAVSASVLTVGAYFANSYWVDIRTVDAPNIIFSMLVTSLATTAIISTRLLTDIEKWSRGRSAILGTVLGVITYGVYEFLSITWKGTQGSHHDFGPIELWMSGRPTPPAFIAYFILMLIVQTWPTVLDPIREQRLRWGPVATAVGAGWISQFILGFPLLESMAWAGTMTAAAQLAMPWQPGRQASTTLNV